MMSIASLQPLIIDVQTKLWAQFFLQTIALRRVDQVLSPVT